jgi:hypothetical protein
METQIEMKNHLLFKLIMPGLILFSIYSCEKDKSASNFDLLTNGSSKVWYLKRIEPPLVIGEFPVCLADDEHNFKSDGKYTVDHMGTFLVDDMGEVSCSSEPNFTSSFMWSFNLTMDTITLIYPSYNCSAKVQKLNSDSLIIEFNNGSSFNTNYYAAKK